MPLQLLYVSGAARPMGDDDISAILSVSRKNNSTGGITGLLLYRDRLFLQVLEGAPHAVRTLYNKIAQDPRHRNAMVMMERTADSRAFGEWSMGFHYLGKERPDEERSFNLSRAALEGRISPLDGGIVLDAVLAFARRDFLLER